MSGEKIPALEEYSAEQILLVRQYSPAVDRYLNIVNNPCNEGWEYSLRWQRHHHWLRAAMATLLKTATASDVCQYWSHAADTLINQVWTKNGGLENTNLGIFAVGKLGACELNLSSDVDLMFVSAKPASGEDLALVQKIIQSLSHTNNYGFCLRVDADLRPGGKLGPLVSSRSQFEDYYWTQGATWERLALVRLRPLCGPQPLLDEVRSMADDFCYRRFLDYTLFDDLKHLRGFIQDYQQNKNQGQLNLKLGVGGIRDIELFIHALQVIHGGKIATLRLQSTDLAVARLIENQLMPEDTLRKLLKYYWDLRELENGIQSINDRQTHSLKVPYPKIIEENTPTQVANKMQFVDSTVSELLGKIEIDREALPTTLESQQQWLKSLGFDQTVVENDWPKLIQLTAKSTSGQRDEKIRRQLLYHFIGELANVGVDLNLGLKLLIDFIKNTRAKASFFTLLLRERALMSDLCVLFSTSPYLGHLVASRPEILDGFILRRQDVLSSDFEQLLEELTDRKKLTEIIAANQLLKSKDLNSFSMQMTAAADEICSLLLGRLKEDFPDARVDILCLGKWGSRELGLKSDLDFVFVTPTAPNDDDNKVARRFISRLTDPHRGGQLYPIDLRLRPSGSAGPLLVPEKDLEEYIKEKAAAWERQSYLRARRLDGSGRDNALRTLCVERGLDQSELEELTDIRKKILKPSSENSIDLKYEAGGIVDIEFAVQIACLKTGQKLKSGSVTALIDALVGGHCLDEKQGRQLAEHYSYLRLIEQLYQIFSQASGSRINWTSESYIRLCKYLNGAQDQISHQLRDVLVHSAEILIPLR